MDCFTDYIEIKYESRRWYSLTPVIHSVSKTQLLQQDLTLHLIKTNEQNRDKMYK